MSLHKMKVLITQTTLMKFIQKCSPTGLAAYQSVM